MKKKDKAVCQKIEVSKMEKMIQVFNFSHSQVDPFHISSSTVPSTRQLQDLKDHIRSMEEEKFHREERFISLKESILRRYMELEEEPETEFERFVGILIFSSELA